MTKTDIATQNEANIIELADKRGVEAGIAKILQQNAALLPKTLEMERIVTAAAFYIANNNDLMRLDKTAKLAMLYGIQKEAMVYLEAGTDYDIVVFKNKPVVCRKKDGWYKIIDMIKPAEIVRFVSNVATTGDEINFNPVTEEVTHTMVGKRHQKIGDIIGAYAYIRFANGFEKTVFWDQEDINHARQLSPSKGSEYSPWNAHSIKMVETKVVKELAKKLMTLFGRRLSPTMQSAANIDEQPVRRISSVGNVEIEDTQEPEYDQYQPQQPDQYESELNMDELPNT